MKTTITVRIESEIANKIRQYVYKSPELTFSGLVDDALREYLNRFEVEDGSTSSIKLKRGRKVTPK